MSEEVPADTGSADPGAELREAATIVRYRYQKGSAAYRFWQVIAGVWERWAERMELGVELTPVAHAEFQAALFSARRYMEMRHGGAEYVTVAGDVSCSACGHVLATPEDKGLRATEMSARLLGHVCPEVPQLATASTHGQEE